MDIFGPDEEFCYQCGGQPDEEHLMQRCQFCDNQVFGGDIRYSCSYCFNSWISRPEWSSDRRDVVVCNQCVEAGANRCMDCQQVDPKGVLREVGGNFFCKACSRKSVQVWCPLCDQRFWKSGYIRGVFYNNLPAMQAACLVSHYRHEHTSSHDLAWQNPRYARRIPNYTYESYKLKVNNQAKRQLIRLIANQVEKGTYRTDAPVAALELIRGFSFLSRNDEKTNQLIAKKLQRLSSTKWHNIDNSQLR